MKNCTMFKKIGLIFGKLTRKSPASGSGRSRSTSGCSEGSGTCPADGQDRIALIMSDWVSARGYAEPDTQEEVVRSLNVTRDELASYCRERYGMSFLSWRKKLRIEEAGRLLVTRSDLSAAEIGRKVGIFDKSDFRRQFRSLEGCTPLEYRDRNIQSAIIARNPSADA